MLDLDKREGLVGLHNRRIYFEANGNERIVRGKQKKPGGGIPAGLFENAYSLEAQRCRLCTGDQTGPALSATS